MSEFAAGFDQETFGATLNGASEVPPATAVTATATFSILFEGPHATYTLTIGGGGLGGITASHIHTGAAGVNGGVWVFLFDGPVKDATLFTGKLGVGSFTQEMVAACTPGCAGGGSFNNILTGARASTVYVNVHTTANTGGAIRGQIHPSSRSHTTTRPASQQCGAGFFFGPGSLGFWGKD